MEKTQSKSITSFKVIEVGINRKPVCDFLLVINNNWQPISYSFEVIAAYWSNFGHCVFEPPFGVMFIFGLSESAYSGLPISVNWPFFASVTAEALRAMIGSKSAISLQRVSVGPKFQVEDVAPTNQSSHKTRLNDLSYGAKIWTDLSSVLSQTDRYRQTDILIARPRLHSMQRGNKTWPEVTVFS